MLFLGTNLSPWSFFIITTALCSLIIISGAVLTKKYLSSFIIDNEDLPTANIIMRQISTLLSVLLAFAVISIWQDYEQQRKNTASEAITLGNIYRDSRGFEKENELKIQTLLVNYTKAIVEDSWPKMREQKESHRAWMEFNKLYGYTVRLTPKNNREEIIYKNTIGNLNELAKFRRLRHLRNITPFIPDVLWATIYISTILLLFSAFTLRMRNKFIQIILTAISAIIFGMVFSLLLLLNHPYSGSLQISPSPIQNLLDDVYPTADLTKVISTGED